MPDEVSMLERIGDGINNPTFANDIAESLPFVLYNLSKAINVDNLNGRAPSDDEINWLAVSNCGPASKALAYALRIKGYEVELVTYRNWHMRLEVKVDDEIVIVDPTLLQFLRMYGVSADNGSYPEKDNATPKLLPVERVFVFKPDEFKLVCDWLATVVKSYNLNREQKVPFISKRGRTPDRKPLKQRADGKTNAVIEKELEKLLDPSNYEGYQQTDEEVAKEKMTYDSRFARYLSEVENVQPVDLAK